MARRRTRVLVAAALIVAAIMVVAVRNHRDERGPGPRVADPMPLPMARLLAITKRVPCPDGAHAVSRDRVRGFHAVAAIGCDDERRSYPSGLWTVSVRKVAQRGVGALATVLDRPDNESSDGDCPGVLVSEPLVRLVSATGDSIAPHGPLDGCDLWQPALDQALRGITWHTISVTRVRLIRGADAIRSGCEEQLKNLFADSSYDGVTVGPLLPAGPLQVCAYRVTDDPLAGTFVSGRTLDASDSDRLRSAVRRGTSQDCPAQRDFAFISRGGVYAEVELGGCWRVVNNRARHGAIDPAVGAEVLRA